MQKILRLPEVITRTGLSRSSIYLFMRQHKFPLKIQLSQRSIGWSEEAINEYIKAKIAGVDYVSK